MHLILDMLRYIQSRHILPLCGEVPLCSEDEQCSEYTLTGFYHSVHFYQRRLTKIMTWISDYTHGYLCAVIIHSWPNYKAGLTKPPVKLRHGWVITSRCLTSMQLLICTVMLVWLKSIQLIEARTSSQHFADYRKNSNISRTKSQNFNDSRLVLQLYLPNPLKPGVRSRMKI